jgi:hypothetical protein
VDLAPGASLSMPLVAGPVASAGRYVVRASVRDLGAAVRSASADPPIRMEAATDLRFEQ